MKASLIVLDILPRLVAVTSCECHARYKILGRSVSVDAS